ncbi:MAG: nucleotide exchange factor GrpE [Acidobacteriota bacterium]
MDPNQKTEETDYSFELDNGETEEVSVDDFIRELEAKEKDLHITADTTFIEIAAGFDDPDEVPDFMRPVAAQNPTQTLKPSPTDASAVTLSAKRLEAEIASLKGKVAGLQEERTELLSSSQRRLKDFEAYKARTERERGETFQRQLSNLATQMLPILDNLDRALESASAMPDEKASGFVQFFDGIALVNQQVNEVLVGMGIDPIATVGEQFDPHFHEAVAVDETSGMPPNTITAELLRGFRIGSNVIRHSMVKVSKGPVDVRQTASLEPKETDSTDESISGPTETFDDVETHSLPELENGPMAHAAEHHFEMSNPATQENQFEIERNGEVDKDQ